MFENDGSPLTIWDINRLDRDVIFNKFAMWTLKRFEKCKPEALVVSKNLIRIISYLICEICLFLNLEIVKFNTLPLPLLYLQDVKTEQKFERKITFQRAADTSEFSTL